MIEQWTCVYQLNKTLTELINLLAIKCRVMKQPLNPSAAPYVHGVSQTDIDHKIEESHNNSTEDKV